MVLRIFPALWSLFEFWHLRRIPSLIFLVSPPLHSCWFPCRPVPSALWRLIGFVWSVCGSFFVCLVELSIHVVIVVLGSKGSALIELLEFGSPNIVAFCGCISSEYRFCSFEWHLPLLPTMPWSCISLSCWVSNNSDKTWHAREGCM